MKLLLFLSLLSAASLAAAPKPPAQPDAGPGGREYRHAKVRKLGPFGEGDKAFWLYEPDAPVPASAPVIAFMHGYMGVDAKAYGGWIEHLVRRGNVVIYPVYQTTLFGAEAYTGNALAALKNAFHLLATAGHVRPDEAGNFAFVAHSLGCPISANIIGMGEKSGLPRAKAFMACHAGDLNSLVTVLPSMLQPPAQIPDLLMLVVVGEGDHFVGDVTGRQIFSQSTGVQPANKNFITIQSDKTGRPGLDSDHLAPLSMNAAYATGATLSSDGALAAPPGSSLPHMAERGRSSGTRALVVPGLGRTDALDFYGYWKWFDALTDAAFYGTHRQWALGDTPEQKFMGKWSDGTPVKPAVVELAK